LGGCLALVALARTSTGLFAALAVFIAIWTGPASASSKLRSTVRALGPMVVLLALWWLTPAKLPGFLDYLKASVPAFESLSWHAFAYYWQALITSLSVAPPIGVLIIVAIPAACVRWRDPDTRLLILIVAVSWVGLLMKRSLSVRFILGAFPAMCLIAAKGAQDLLEFVRHTLPVKISRRAVPILALLLAAIAGGWACARAISFPFLMDVAYETASGHRAVIEWIADHVDGSPTFLINGWDQVSAEAVDFHLATRLWPHWRHRMVTDVTLADPDETPESLEEFQQAVLSALPNHLVHLGNTPVASAGAWWAYRATIVDCWDGQWQSTTSVWIHIWDREAVRQVLSRPLAFARAGPRENLREQLWYPLQVDVSHAVCADE
jgi:hypothetical protein